MMMPVQKRPLALWMLVALSVAAITTGLFLRHRHSAPHGHSHAAAPALPEGKRWDTDAPLRTGMRQIRDAVEPVVHAHDRGKLTHVQAEALAASIQERVNFLFANCKLPPQADAALHTLITDLLSGAALLKKDSASAEGLSLLVQALRQYPELFADPTWQPLTSASQL